MKCEHPYCKNRANRILKDNKGIYAYFCQKHFDAYIKLPLWQYDPEIEKRTKCKR